MSEEEFEVRGAHEDALEHPVEHGIGLGQEIALFSAVLATLGAVVSFLGGHTQNEALYYKNEAVLMKARVSDAWSYYQATSTKLHLTQMAAMLSPEHVAEFQAQGVKYTRQKVELEAKARDYDRKSEEADLESHHALAPMAHSPADDICPESPTVGIARLGALFSAKGAAHGLQDVAEGFHVPGNHDRGFRGSYLERRPNPAGAARNYAWGLQSR